METEIDLIVSVHTALKESQKVCIRCRRVIKIKRGTVVKSLRKQAGKQPGSSDHAALSQGLMRRDCCWCCHRWAEHLSDLSTATLLTGGKVVSCGQFQHGKGMGPAHIYSMPLHLDALAAFYCILAGATFVQGGFLNVIEFPL